MDALTDVTNIRGGSSRCRFFRTPYGDNQPKEDSPMAILKFKADEVEALCEHAMQSKDWSMGYSTDIDPAPGLFLVGDHGVYLMSNGTPSQKKPEGAGNVVSYAEGCNPHTDPGFYEAKVAVFGGDDGVDVLPFAGPLLAMIKENATAKHLQIELTPDILRVVGVN